MALAINKEDKIIFYFLVEDPLQAKFQENEASKKIIVQIIPKAQSGGFQSGCFKARYQGPISVNNLPDIMTTNSQTAAAMI